VRVTRRGSACLVASPTVVEVPDRTRPTTERYSQQRTRGEGAHVSPNDQGDVVDGQEVTSRRNVLIGGASLAAFAWAAPAVTRLPGAYARGTELTETVLRDTTTPGLGTLNVTDSYSSLQVHIWGGGGSGGTGPGNAAGAGGGGGGYRFLEFSPAAGSYDYSVGAGGPAAANNSPGTAGGATWFGSDVDSSRAGGGGAGGAAGGSGGAGGSGMFSGGSGSVRAATNTGGGGGGSAGSGSNGLAATGAAGGAGGSGTYPGSTGGSGGADGTGFGAGGGGSAGNIGGVGAGIAGRILVIGIP
jgi:hypothetical protein